MRADIEILQIIQGTPEWYAARAGVITASAASKFMGSKIVSSKYILQKQAECFFGISQEEMDKYVGFVCYESEQSLSLNLKGEPTNFRYGHICEPLARRYYEKKYDETVREIGFIKLNNSVIGVSPDGMLLNKNAGVEFKNPASLSAHFEASKLTCAADLKEYSVEYYWQVVACLFVTGCDTWDWVSFNSNPVIEPEKAMYCLQVSNNEVLNDINALSAKIEENKHLLLK